MELEKLDNSVFFSKNNFESRPMQIQSNAGLAKGLSLLRSGIYTDKMMAVIREYICNAIDEHIKYCPERAIDLTLNSQEFKVRDYGLGLDKEMVFGVFGAFFESTKTKDEIGGFGLGSKSGHAYNDVFHIKSIHNGFCSSYSFVLSVDERGLEEAKCYLTNTEPSNEDSGIEVHIPLIESSHEPLFLERVRKFGKYCDFPLKLNGELLNPLIPTITLGQFKIYKSNDYYHGTSYVKMGPVIYEAEFLNLDKSLGNGYDVIVDVPINSFPIPPSRETIIVNTTTIERGKELCEEFKNLIYQHLNSKEFKASPVDIFNICHNRTGQFNFEFAWLNPELIKNFLIEKYKDVIDELVKFQFFKNDNVVYEFFNSRLRNVCRDRWSVAKTLLTNSKIVLFDDINFGEFRYNQFEEKMIEQGLDTKNFYFIKNPTFPLDQIPDVLKDLFIDFRGFVWKQPERNKRTGPSYDRSLIKAEYNGHILRLDKEEWIKKLGDRKDVVVHYNLLVDLNSLDFETIKAEKFFFDELKIPTYKAWIERNRKAITEEYEKYRQFEFLKTRTNKFISELVENLYSIEKKYSSHYNMLDLKKENAPNKKFSRLIEWVNEDKTPIALLARNYDNIEYKDKIVVESMLKSTLARLLKIKQKKKEEIIEL